MLFLNSLLVLRRLTVGSGHTRLFTKWDEIEKSHVKVLIVYRRDAGDAL